MPRRQNPNSEKKSTEEFHKTVPVIRDFSLNPSCSHGPTILFDRNGVKFFACSAYRSRKLCPFYLPEDNWKGQDQSSKNKKAALGHLGVDSKKKQQNDDKGDKKSLKNIPLNKNLPVATQNDKGEAQYHFTEGTVEFFIDQFRNLGMDSILCIGTPSLHEYIREKSADLKMKSFLLDIDQRLAKKNSPKQYGHYNMCNHHFFGGENLHYKEFLKKSHNLAIVTDPPFGVKVELIWNGCMEGVMNDLKESKGLDQTEGEALCEIFWVFPYFLEGHILNKCTQAGLKMSDFPIEYRNHAKFTGNNKSKSSPVRVFTTVPLSDLKLPYESFRYCEFCSKWVDKNNLHCRLCNVCPTKDGGKTYVHCKKCKKCVKPTWIHCDSPCGSCHLEGAECRPKIAKNKKGSKEAMKKYLVGMMEQEVITPKSKKGVKRPNPAIQGQELKNTGRKLRKIG